MTRLVCSVENCAYNKEHLCSLDEIKVDGEHATDSHSTCCASFRNSSESYSNCVDCECAKTETEIECHAHNCTYNADCKCHADSIDVCGCGSDTARGTACSTFRCE